MASLNKNVSHLLTKYKAHGATDVTGFGILGHAENLAAAQREQVDLIIEDLPIIAGMDRKVSGMADFAVCRGRSAETSGGILTMLPRQEAK